jgi:hypothetical protein
MDLNCYNGFKRFKFGEVRNKKKEEKTGFQSFCLFYFRLHPT